MVFRIRMPKTVKSVDTTGTAAAKFFAALNSDDVEYLSEHPFNYPSIPSVGVLVTDVNPNELIYPEGWYFAKGTFRNKHNSSTGAYEEIQVLKRDGTPW
ncbi:hypothetical protein IKE80_00010 [Candidatus Saccharibacteria bacterium]|nr:hypothetical protein [Candidatus Saccharibacteria bacterium]